MQKPISLKVDFQANAGYVEYRSLREGQYVAHKQRMSQDVSVDFDAESQIVGIQLQAFDGETLGVARRFAQAHELVFPEILTRTATSFGTPAGQLLSIDLLICNQLPRLV